MKRWCLRLLLLPVFLLREIWRRLRAGSGNERLIRRAPYAGGPVAVVALYQDGKVRADILALLLSLRRRGVYVIAVNTGELDDAGARLPADCYLERSNYGRDFGSYQAGIRRATSLAEAHGQAPERLLLLNDSVFYVAAGLDEFLNRLLTSAADICSATESTEVLPHQTSFCLSFSRACLAHPAFARFWRRYVATDLRPLTVLLGEIALSRVLYRAGLSHAALAGRDMVRKIATGGGGAGPSAQWQAAGNATHRAPELLLDLGLPMVKLDLMQRAGRSDSDLNPVLQRLAPQDSALLGELWRMNAERLRSTGRLDRLGMQCGLA